MRRNDNSAPIEAAWPSGGVSVVFAADAGYAPYLATALASLAASASPDTLYDIIVLSSGIDAAEQKKIGAVLAGAENIALRFFEVREAVEKRAGDFFVNAHISVATYYRLFTPSIFENFDKILYLDGDIVILEDVANLYTQDLRGRAAGVMRDFFAIRDLPRRHSAAWRAQLDLQNTADYFNAGVLLFDLAKLRAENYEEKWFKRLQAIKTPRLHDQDILNHTLEGDTIQLDPAWNSPAWMESLGEAIWPGELPESLYTQYQAACQSPKILHYLSRHKPWDLPQLPLAGRFWELTARTPYYQALIFNNLKRLNAENDCLKGRLHFPPVALKYFFYTLMASLPPGESGARFRAKAYRIKKMNPGLKSLMRNWH